MLAEKVFIQEDKKLPYLFHAPEQVLQGEQGEWPLVLFLHGAGERGDNLEMVTYHGFASKMTEPENQDAPFIFVAPQCGEDAYWTEELSVLSGLLDEMIAHYPVDEQRIYLTGLSMGAIGAWNLALQQPERFAAMVPVCGALRLPEHRAEEFPQTFSKKDIPQQLEKLQDLPIWAFHGEEDDVVPVEETTTMIDYLKRFNNQVQLTVYPGVGHDSWVPAFQEKRLYTWLFRQHT
ncbi:MULTISPECIES: carboxylesterase family protein [Gracilibacillus]|uniref:carboxylesterase family protein n=1 Tax=Gracilibacillus TaxID=74385 RepID=UPI000825F1E7|nr:MULTISPECIES: prolyl oligopeptidase family serine peptidase [Gracilibacillus]